MTFLTFAYGITLSVAILGFVFLLFKLIQKLEWKNRHKFSLALLLLPLVQFFPYLVGQFYKRFGFISYPELGLDGPGAGIIFLFPIAGAIIGYIFGLCADIFNKK